MEHSTQPMVCPSHTVNYVGAFALGFIIGAGLLSLYSTGTYQKGFGDAKRIVTESSLGGMFRSPSDVRVLSGVVTAVSGNTITMRIQQTNPFDDASLAERTVNVSSDTKITKRTPGDMQAFQTEMESYIKKVQSGKNAGTPPTPPQPIITTITLADIVVGSTVTVTASENVATSKSIPATEVQVQ